MYDLENQRNQNLIEDREEYEKLEKDNLNKELEEFENGYLENVVENMLDSEEFDKLMQDRVDFINQRYDFERDIEYDDIEDFYYDYDDVYYDYDEVEEAYDYPIGPEGDMVEGYDYPEGPDENLGGVYFNDYFSGYEQYDFEDERYIELLIEKAISQQEDAYEDQMSYLIREHLKDEKAFLDSIVEDIIQEEYYVPKVIDEVIMDNVDMEYDEKDFDYGSALQYWYGGPDKSIEEPIEKFDRDQVPEPPEVIAFSKKEELKLKSIIKEYFKKNDALDRIVKEKLKEKKFK